VQSACALIKKTSGLRGLRWKVEGRISGDDMQESALQESALHALESGWHCKNRRVARGSSLAASPACRVPMPH
jgi:hypothetical protein